jgi:hypothetical protein
MSKYDGLAEFLKRRTSAVTRSFEEVASVVAGGLPPSAYRYIQWWANSPIGHPYSRVWLDAGWATSATNLVSRKVTFTPR